MQSGRHVTALSIPGASRFFLPGAVARLGVAMTGTAILWSVQGSSGSFGWTGAATGAFAIADAAGGPQVARLIDRRGQRSVVSVSVTVFAVAAALLVVACAWSWPGPVTMALSALSGASIPPIGALVSARWRRLLEPPARLTPAVRLTPPLRRRPTGEADLDARREAATGRVSAADGGLLPAAMSLDGATNEVAFLLGPVLVTTLSATVAPWAGLVLAALLVVLGTAGLLTARTSEPTPGGAARGMLVDRRLLNRSFGVLFAANLAMGLFFGGVGVVITAFALARDAGALAGVITAGGGVASLVAGLAYGSAERDRPVSVMIGASCVLTIGCALLALAPGLPALMAGYALVGGCVALVLIPGAVVLQRSVPAGVYTQALTWVNSASAVGIAVSAPLIGGVVQVCGWSVGFLALAGLSAALPLILVAARHRIGRPAVG